MAVLRGSVVQWLRDGKRCAYCRRAFSVSEPEVEIIRANKEAERPTENNSHE